MNNPSGIWHIIGIVLTSTGLAYGYGYWAGLTTAGLLFIYTAHAGTWDV